MLPRGDQWEEENSGTWHARWGDKPSNPLGRTFNGEGIWNVQDRGPTHRIRGNWRGKNDQFTKREDNQRKGLAAILV